MHRKRCFSLVLETVFFHVLKSTALFFEYYFGIILGCKNTTYECFNILTITIN